MIPVHHPGQTFEAHQAEMAKWLGTDVEEMNAAHDALHAALCRWLAVPSYALLDANGLLDSEKQFLAHLEEQAVLHTQRLMHHHGVGVPR
jgi:hypothetical protein